MLASAARIRKTNMLGRKASVHLCLCPNVGLTRISILKSRIIKFFAKFRPLVFSTFVYKSNSLAVCIATTATTVVVFCSGCCLLAVWISSVACVSACPCSKTCSSWNSQNNSKHTGANKSVDDPACLHFFYTFPFSHKLCSCVLPCDGAFHYYYYFSMQEICFEIREKLFQLKDSGILSHLHQITILL